MLVSAVQQSESVICLHTHIYTHMCVCVCVYIYIYICVYIYISLEKEMVTHSSILALKIPWTEGPVGLLSMGLQRVGHN